VTDPGPPASGLVLYETEDGRTRVQCRFDDNTLWLTQAQMADLFQVGAATVQHHLKGVYDEAEQAPEATIRKYRMVRTEGGLKQAATCKPCLQVRRHRPVTGMTAPELIAARADASQPNMGLTTWSGGVRRHGVTRAKNYLREPEITELNRILTVFRDFAEEARCRAHLEAEGEADALRALEEVAKKLPKRETACRRSGER